MKKKKIILIISIAVILLLTVGISFAAYTYTRVGSNQELVLGDIYMHFNETNGIILTDVVPSEAYDATNYFEFTISGKNTYTEKDIYYDISLLYGDSIANKTRIEDEFLKFTLVEIKDGISSTVVDSISYSDLQNKKLYVNTISKNSTSEVNITYRLYMWISTDIVIGNNNQDYTIDEWNNIYASIKVKVNGDFEEKERDKPAILSPILKVEVSSYELASSSDFAGGLVAINTDGTLYDETDLNQEIREYRYTGLDVNNYIFLDTNGDSVQDENEIWRIVGIFKNLNNEWNLKLMRNTVLTSDEIPETYTYDGISYTLKSGSTEQTVYWDYKETTNWTTVGLQYWLNDTTTNGYFGTLSSGIQNIIDTNYIYYLGNNKYGSSGDTTVSAYINERDATNIYSANKSTWNGSIALLYPSDYGYSANSSYWSETLLYYYHNAAFSTSWMQNANHMVHEWFLSPSSRADYRVSFWTTSGYTGGNSADSRYVVRPVLNLIANFGSLLGSGTESDPYKIN